MGAPADKLAMAEAVDEIMRVYRSLPPRPTIEEVEAAMSVIQTAEAEEKLMLEEVSRLKKPQGLPEELFFVLQEVKRNMGLLQGYEQRRDAVHVLDLDRRFHVFDELIQRASKLVPGGGGGGGGEGESQLRNSQGGLVVTGGDGGVDVGLAKGENVEKLSGISDASKGVMVQKGSFKGGLTSGGDSEKLSLIKVASLIETSVKNETKVLDLQGKLMDRIEWLPLSLGKLSAITELNLSENRIMALPSTINGLRSLTKLDIHSNQLINLPDSFGELSYLIDLDLRGNRLKTLPSSFGNLTSLAKLDLSSNRFSMLPDSLGKLTNLKYLNVETNELEEIPHSIGSCRSLMELRLDFNQLRALPEAIGKLESLEILTFHYNRIKSFPTTMSSLSNLKELEASFNELESIPESLCFVTTLVKLNVGNNFADMRALPRSIGNLEKLEELDISYNQIRILPDSFRLLSNLRVLRVEETPLEVPPRHVTKLGAQAVVSYMAELIQEREVASQDVEKIGLCSWFCNLFQRHQKKRNIKRANGMS
ncbi:hypothetical protein QJS04_geneDACA008791 [Acorus gramineus]|uniref:Disease resistance R13L4/SHOC-2-like LRR domain-containing protein n=1 Tax=Acorus gramineus TaxID=55184 RepID=A0AAV9ACE1_ACOGR|nr:hypothetical protein QJS04_geneDACA008791 [Acorus gramineus]